LNAVLVEHLSHNGLSASSALTTREETKQDLANGSDEISLKLLEHFHVQVEGLIGLFDDAIGHGLVNRQGIHRRAIGGLEGFSSAISGNT
jgi:hypothetical protein